MIIINIIVMAILNRIRGMDLPFHTEINYLGFGILMGITHQLDWWGYLVMALVMFLGQATGWSEFVNGCTGNYILGPESDETWISKIVTIKNQWTCFLWGCIRASIWLIPLYLGLLICGVNQPVVLLGIPFMYCSYRIGYLIDKKGDTFANSEPIWGGIIGLITG